MSNITKSLPQIVLDAQVGPRRINGLILPAVLLIALALILIGTMSEPNLLAQPDMPIYQGEDWHGNSTGSLSPHR